MTFDDAWAHARDVEGWLTEAQARRLFAAAALAGAGEGVARVVEIGSSCWKPYRPLTASSTALNTAAMSHTSRGTRSSSRLAAAAVS